jgi:hypothetical protein
MYCPLKQARAAGEGRPPGDAIRSGAWVGPEGLLSAWARVPEE